MVEVSSIGKTEEERDIMLVKVFFSQQYMGQSQESSWLKLGGEKDNKLFEIVVSSLFFSPAVTVRNQWANLYRYFFHFTK